MCLKSYNCPPLKQASQDVKSPLLTLPPRQLWSLVFLYLRRFLRRSTTTIEFTDIRRDVKKLLCNIYRGDVSIDDRLQDLHPFCQVLSVDKFQGEVVLGRQISHKDDCDCYEITTEGPSTRELHVNGVASPPPDRPRSTLASWGQPLPGRGRTGF